VRYLQGTHESVYEYDGDSKRVRIKELTSSVETKNETFVWCGARICQKRASNGTTIVRSYFDQGFEASGPADYFYARDRLGSVRDIIASDGISIASRLGYSPWGVITESGSGALSDFGFTGHYFDRPSGLGLTRYRAYDPSLAIWLSKDPIGLRGGANLYQYVGGDPVNLFDSTGLSKSQCEKDEKPPNKCEMEKARCEEECVDKYSKQVQNNCLHADVDPAFAQDCEAEQHRISDDCIDACRARSCP